MGALFENFVAAVWNGREHAKPTRSPDSVELGYAVVDEQITGTRICIPDYRRNEHIGILGRTGSGKSSVMKAMALQDVKNDHGWLYFDLHGDTEPFLMAAIAREERRRGVDLSGRVIRVAPGDVDRSVGINVLEKRAHQNAFVQIAEFAQILRKHWHLDSFGAQTDELLRNSLHVLSDNDLTLVELLPLLTNGPFRSACVKRVHNPEVRAYFELRFDQASAAMQATMRNPILNKTSFFTADPHFRHIVGQQHSTFDVRDAMDRGCWVIVNLSKGELGEQSLTLGGLQLTKVKNALFGRRSKSLFTVYADELQNFVSSDSGIEVLLSEARKFGVSVVSATQYLDALPTITRSALMAVQTHILFRLSAPDAEKLSGALGGGRTLGALLRTLPKRHMVVQSGPDPWHLVLANRVPELALDYSDLLDRSNRRWTKDRTDIEREIAARQPSPESTSKEVLGDWE